MNGWYYVLIAFALWIIGYNVYNRGDGKHRMFDDDLIPSGAVWMRSNGVWYTQNQNRGLPEPRRFDIRSNPLDHEIEWVSVEVPPKYRKIPREVEY